MQRTTHIHPAGGAQPANAVYDLYYGRRRRMMFRIGTYLALLRAAAVGRLVDELFGASDLLHHTQARLARTRNTLRELICHGFDSPEGQAALQRLRAVHQHVKASADDYRYVLALFFLEPIRWNAAMQGPPLGDDEATILLGFWTRVGQEMRIPDSQRSLPEWQAFQRQYEAQHWAFSPQGQHLANLCLKEVVTLSLPWGSRGFFRQLMRVSLDPALQSLLKLPAPHWLWRYGLQIWLRRSAH